ncbi:MAG: PDZ domain-containing protein [Vitreimonas sp.]
MVPLAVLLTAPAAQTADRASASAEADEALEEAREELRQARDELRRAAEQLARVAREQGVDSPDAQAFAFIANPRRAMLGVGIAAGPEKDGVVRGVKIVAVTPGGGADKAGLKTGDLLLSANGQSLAAKKGERPGPERKLRDLMAELKPGDEVRVAYERDGKKASAGVIAQRPQDMEMGLGFLDLDEDDEDHRGPFRIPLPPHPPRPPNAWQEDGPGLQLAKLDEDLAAYFNTRDGVLVVKAPKDNRLGLKSGDVIRRIDGEAVDSPVAALDRLHDAGEDEVSVEVLRHGKTETLRGRWSEPRRGFFRKRVEIRDEDG